MKHLNSETLHSQKNNELQHRGVVTMHLYKVGDGGSSKADPPFHGGNVGEYELLPVYPLAQGGQHALQYQQPSPLGWRQISNLYTSS